jgi:plastocyanin
MIRTARSRPRRTFAHRSWLCALACIAVAPFASAGEGRVEVLTREGGAVTGVAVVLEIPGAPRSAARHSVRMDQQNRRFVPQVLVVEAGTSVEFPNSDQVSHQVYSFSPARRFQLPLYRGTTHPPVVFSQPGLVVLGCNIHDEMVGYVLVTESPYHATTDETGAARFRDLPAGSYHVTVWGPLIHDGGGTVTGTLAITGDGAQTLSLRLRDPLRHNPSPRPGRVDWDGY